MQQCVPSAAQFLEAFQLTNKKLNSHSSSTSARLRRCLTPKKVQHHIGFHTGQVRGKVSENELKGVGLVNKHLGAHQIMLDKDLDQRISLKFQLLGKDDLTVRKAKIGFGEMHSKVFKKHSQLSVHCQKPSKEISIERIKGEFCSRDEFLESRELKCLTNMRPKTGSLQSKLNVITLLSKIPDCSPNKTQLERFYDYRNQVEGRQKTAEKEQSPCFETYLTSSTIINKPKKEIVYSQIASENNSRKQSPLRTTKLKEPFSEQYREKQAENHVSDSIYKDLSKSTFLQKSQWPLSAQGLAQYSSHEQKDSEKPTTTLTNEYESVRLEPRHVDGVKQLKSQLSLIQSVRAMSVSSNSRKVKASPALINSVRKSSVNIERQVNTEIKNISSPFKANPSKVTEIKNPQKREIDFCLEGWESNDNLGDNEAKKTDQRKVQQKKKEFR